MKPLPTQRLLKRRLEYLPEEGKLIWLSKPAWWKDSARWNARYAGKVAGNISTDGHIQVMILGERYFADRIVWKMAMGKDPSGRIKHLNGDNSDNRLENLYVLQIQ